MNSLIAYCRSAIILLPDNTGCPESRFTQVVKYLSVISFASGFSFYLQQLAKANMENNHLNNFCSTSFSLYAGGWYPDDNNIICHCIFLMYIQSGARKK
jgi:hypothetical protein